MKVLFLTPWYPNDEMPQYGVFVRDQAQAVAKSNQVVVISSTVDYSRFGFLSYKVQTGLTEEVSEHRLVIRRSFPVFNQINFFLLTLWYTRRICRQFRPDVIHANIGFPGAFWGYMTSVFAQVPFVITEHSTWFVGNLRSVFHRWMTLRFMRSAAAIVSVSERSAQDIFKYTGIHPVVVPNIIQVSDFTDLLPAPVTDEFNFGFLGGLNTNRKGLDVLLRALSTIQRKFKLHIGGKGNLLETYRLMAMQLGLQDRCHFYGLIPDGKVPEFMGRLNCFVSASRGEGFGMVIAEAMACGLPVIATKSGGPQDFVTNACGRLVPTEDVSALREALEWMMEHGSAFDPTHIKRHVISQFAPEVISEKLQEIYRRSIDEAK